jgi:hypothetical protein
LRLIQRSSRRWGCRCRGLGPSGWIEVSWARFSRKPSTSRSGSVGSSRGCGAPGRQSCWPRSGQISNILFVQTRGAGSGCGGVLLRDGVVGDDELTHARGLLVVEVVSYSVVSSATTPINDTRLAKFSLEIVQLIAIHNSSRAEPCRLLPFPSTLPLSCTSNIRCPLWLTNHSAEQYRNARKLFRDQH